MALALDAAEARDREELRLAGADAVEGRSSFAGSDGSAGDGRPEEMDLLTERRTDPDGCDDLEIWFAEGERLTGGTEVRLAEKRVAAGPLAPVISKSSSESSASPAAAAAAACGEVRGAGALAFFEGLACDEGVDALRFMGLDRVASDVSNRDRAGAVDGGSFERDAVLLEPDGLVGDKVRRLDDAVSRFELVDGCEEEEEAAWARVRVWEDGSGS